MESISKIPTEEKRFSLNDLKYSALPSELFDKLENYNHFTINRTQFYSPNDIFGPNGGQ